MDISLSAALRFGQLLEKTPQASAFYNSCTPQQRQAILLQLSELHSAQQLEAFVDHLPSAAL